MRLPGREFKSQGMMHRAPFPDEVTKKACMMVEPALSPSPNHYSEYSLPENPVGNVTSARNKLGMC